jgi:S-formylglutathione hydrolase FrmB
LYDDNRRFRDHLRDRGLNLTYEEHPGRDHEWGYWDQQIRRVLDWLPLP